MPIQFRLEHVIDKLAAPAPALVKQRTLRELAGVKLPVREAQHAWERIMDHKWYLGERLGRDVGLRVAAVDYFENIAPATQTRRRNFRGGLPARLPMMQPLSR